MHKVVDLGCVKNCFGVDSAIVCTHAKADHKTLGGNVLGLRTICTNVFRAFFHPKNISFTALGELFSTVSTGPITKTKYLIK